MSNANLYHREKITKDSLLEVRTGNKDKIRKARTMKIKVSGFSKYG